jgi:NDP-sugar pyrophosphorylase family protein
MTRFIEKSQSSSSDLLSTGIYAISNYSLKKIRNYLADSNNHDSPGYFIEWLSKNQDIYGYILGGLWWDIGSLETYEKAKSSCKW